MTDKELIERLVQITTAKWVTQDVAPEIRPHPKDRRHCIIIGTSGSHDYLEDPTKDKRFWPDLKLTSSKKKEDLSCDGIRDASANPNDIQKQEMP